MLIDELYQKKDIITSIADKYGAHNFQIFGSVARREETEESDINILISLPRGYDMFKQHIPLKEELMKILGRRVDLIVRHEINKYLKTEILDNARDL